MQPVATFSIVAYDPHSQEWGVAVQSKFLAAAAVVSWRAPERVPWRLRPTPT
jgi:uncharacterized Ntn-hydrolase superfamily protein